MIVFDFVPNPRWKLLHTDREIINASAELFNLALPGMFKLYVGGVDLSWDKEIPMMDYARSWFYAVSDVKPQDSRGAFSLDFEEFTHLSVLDNGAVQIRPDYVDRSAICNHGELKRATAKFGITIYEMFASAYPLIYDNAEFAEWYPLSAMHVAAEM